MPGHRIEKSSGTSASQRQRYIYDGSNILVALDGNNEALHTFTMGLGLDEVLSMHSRDGSDFFFQTDALSSLRALTDDTADIKETFEYQAFGRTFARNGSNTSIPLAQRISPLLYTAKIFDDELDNQHNDHRSVDQQIGRFTSEDPLGMSAGNNIYLYASANPIRFNDPQGLYDMDYSAYEGGPYSSQDLVNFAAGYGDTFGFPIFNSRFLRDTTGFGKGGVDYNSDAYRAGSGVGMVQGVVTIALPALGLLSKVRGFGWLNFNPTMRVGPGSLPKSACTLEGSPNALRLSFGPREILNRPHFDLRSRIPYIPPYGGEDSKK